VMNRAPFGGALQLSYDTDPPIALTTDVALSAVQWTDDPDDLPLKYAFAYTPYNSALPPTSLGPASIAATAKWLPTEGNWTALCRVSDVYGAGTRPDRRERPRLQTPSFLPRSVLSRLSPPFTRAHRGRFAISRRYRRAPRDASH